MRMLKPLAVVAAMTMFVAASTARIAPPPQVTSASLGEKTKQFLGYSQDFLNMAKTYLGNKDILEYTVALELHAIADRESERLDNADTLLLIYSGTSCQTDLTLSRALVTNQLLTASKYTGLEIDDTQGNLTSTHMPGVAALAVRMKDDLRDARDKLDQARTTLK